MFNLIYNVALLTERKPRNKREISGLVPVFSNKHLENKLGENDSFTAPKSTRRLNYKKSRTLFTVVKYHISQLYFIQDLYKTLTLSFSKIKFARHKLLLFINSYRDYCNELGVGILCHTEIFQFENLWKMIQFSDRF